MPDIEEFANKYFFQSEKQIEFVCLSSFGYWNSSFSELRKRAREFRHHVNETRALELNFRGILVQSCLKFQQFYLVKFKVSTLTYGKMTRGHFSIINKFFKFKKRLQ